MTVATLVTVIIFLTGMVLGGFKWLHSFVVRVEQLIVKFDERSIMISNHLRKIDKTLEALSNADQRIGYLENGHNDHEGRIRDLEHNNG